MDIGIEYKVARVARGRILSYNDMRHQESPKGHGTKVQTVHKNVTNAGGEDFVLEKSIFNNIFEKDIRRVFIYKKAERLAKALHLVTPAFAESAALKNRIDAIAIGLVDAAVLAPSAARGALSRELLLLSSILSVARTGGLLSAMNADLIVREAHILLQEVAVYEEPRIFMDDASTLSDIAKNVQKQSTANAVQAATPAHVRAAFVRKRSPVAEPVHKGHAKDMQDTPMGRIKDRQEAVLSVIRAKGSVSIKDISTMIRGVSEKTVQRELAALVSDGLIEKRGERRWSVYSLAI